MRHIEWQRRTVTKKRCVHVCNTAPAIARGELAAKCVLSGKYVSSSRHHRQAHLHLLQCILQRIILLPQSAITEIKLHRCAASRSSVQDASLNTMAKQSHTGTDSVRRIACGKQPNLQKLSHQRFYQISAASDRSCIPDCSLCNAVSIEFSCEV